jgi:hypothetical protein
MILILVVGGASCVTCLVITQRLSSPRPVAPPTAVSALKPPNPQREPPTPPWITSERPYVKFLPPTTWRRQISQDREWGTFSSPTGDAVLAFTTFNQPGESTARLGRAASVLGVTGVDWRAPRYGTIGREPFTARMADGVCNFKGPNGYIWYATVDTGSVDQILLIFTVAGTAPPNRRAEARAAIETLQRR